MRHIFKHCLLEYILDILVLVRSNLLFAPLNTISLLPTFSMHRHHVPTKRLLILLLLLGRAVLANYNGVVTFIRLKSKLLQRLEVFFGQFANFSAEHSLGCGSGIDTTGLDGNY